MATTTTQTHSTASTILGYIPLVLAALRAALAINSEVGHVPAAQVVKDSIAAGAAIGQQIPETHVQMISQLADTLAPTVLTLVQQATAKTPEPAPAP